MIRKYELEIKNNEPTEPIGWFGSRAKLETLEEVDQAYTILDFLEKNADYSRRIESPFMSIFSNNKQLLVDLNTKANLSGTLWEPHAGTVDLLQSEPNTVIVTNPTEYQYKVYIKGYGKLDDSFVKWAKNNADKVKVRVTKLGNNHYCKSLYFYVRNDKILDLLHLMGIKIRKVERLVYLSNIDK